MFGISLLVKITSLKGLDIVLERFNLSFSRNELKFGAMFDPTLEKRFSEFRRDYQPRMKS